MTSTAIPNDTEVVSSLPVQSESEVEGDCWRWQGHHRLEDGRPLLVNQYVYRVIYEAVAGELPDEVVLHHRCHNPWCVNPFHLSPMSRGEHLNEHRPLMPVVCRNGHLMDAENLYEWKGKRYCRACHAANARKRRAAR